MRKGILDFRICNGTMDDKVCAYAPAGLSGLQAE